MNRDFVLLWQGQLVSQFGQQAYALAMVYWLMEATGSASLMGLLMMASLLPGVVLGPLGGAVADRHSRLGLIIGADLVRGLAISILVAISILRPGDIELVVAALFGVALVNGVVGAVFQPAIMAAVPDLVPREKLVAANSTLQFTTQASILVGQAIGGLLYRSVGATSLFAINAAAYIVSAFTEMFIRLPARRRTGRADATQRLSSYFTDAMDGIRFVWQRRGMRTFLLTAAGVNFFAMPVILLLPFYAADHLGRDAAWYGFLLAALGGGAMAGYTLTGVLKITAAQRPWCVIGALLLTGLAFVLLGHTGEPFIALMLLFLSGIFTGSINVFVISLFQGTTPDDMRGRVMSVVITMSGVAAPLGMVLGGVIGDLTGKDIGLLYPACGTAIAVMTLIAAGRREFREYLQWDTWDLPRRDYGAGVDG